MKNFLEKYFPNQTQPLIMGIVNCTPDSFSDGGVYNRTKDAVLHSLQLINDGADIIDIGGESTRPGSDQVNEDEELQRTIPVIKEILKVSPNSKISIDTTKAEVAKQALDNGAFLVNDVSAFSQEQEKMIPILKEYSPAVCLMHKKGNPKTMQQEPFYNNVVEEVHSYLQERISFVQSLGCTEILADIGIGFGKTYEHNIQLLKNLDSFLTLNVPLLLGISRKNFLGVITGIKNPAERDIATVVAHTLLLKMNISVLRVHNVDALHQMKKIAKILE
jgi:dihydropteroate synthase